MFIPETLTLIQGERPAQPVEAMVIYMDNMTSYYVITGSIIVGRCLTWLDDGDHVDRVTDIDGFTAREPIETEEQFIKIVKDHEEYLNEFRQD